MNHLSLALWLEKADSSWGCFLSVTVNVSRFSSSQAEVFMGQEKTQAIYYQIAPQVLRWLSIPLYFLLPSESSVTVLLFFFFFCLRCFLEISGRNKMECVHSILSGTSSLQSSIFGVAFSYVCISRFFPLIFNSTFKIFLGFLQSYQFMFSSVVMDFKITHLFHYF